MKAKPAAPVTPHVTAEAARSTKLTAFFMRAFQPSFPSRFLDVTLWICPLRVLQEERASRREEIEGDQLSGPLRT